MKIKRLLHVLLASLPLFSFAMSEVEREAHELRLSFAETSRGIEQAEQFLVGADSPLSDYQKEILRNSSRLWKEQSRLDCRLLTLESEFPEDNGREHGFQMDACLDKAARDRFATLTFLVCPAAYLEGQEPRCEALLKIFPSRR